MAELQISLAVGLSGRYFQTKGLRGELFGVGIWNKGLRCLETGESPQISAGLRLRGRNLRKKLLGGSDGVMDMEARCVL